MLNLHLQNQFVVTYFAYLYFKDEKTFFSPLSLFLLSPKNSLYQGDKYIRFSRQRRQ